MLVKTSNIVINFGEVKEFGTKDTLIYEVCDLLCACSTDSIIVSFIAKNEIVIYSDNITSKSDLAKTIVHEYAHYLQDPKWMTRYYGMGYTYNSHPYEREAFKIENENWYKICK